MDPVFVVGVSRSGTTYLHHLFNTHPQIRLSYEGHLFNEGWECYRDYQDLTNRKQFEQLIEELVKCDRNERLNDWIGSSISDSVDELFDRHQQNSSFTDLIEHIYQLPGPVDCWGNKMLRVEMAKGILKHWPDARFIVLIRDPRAVYASQKKFFPGRRLIYSAIYWNMHALAIKEELIPKEKLLLFKYEDLVQNPREYLEQTLKFLGIWDQEAAKQMLETHPASSKSLQKWRSSLTDDEVLMIERVCFDEMKYYGYEPELAKSRIQLSTFTKAVETFLDKKSSIPWRLSDWKRKNVLRRFLATIRN